MKEGRSLQNLAIELERQRTAKRDFLVPSNEMQLIQTPNDFRMSIQSEPYAVNEIAHRQIGQYLNIPYSYYDRMRTDFPELLLRNVNGWLNRKPDEVRMVRTLDGAARAVLSRRYRRIDNQEIAEAVLPVIAQMPDAGVESCELTDSRMYLKVVTPRITREVTKGDVVQAGVVISNSEVGMGSVSVSPLIYRLVCTNGMIAQDGRVRKTHIGRLNESQEDWSIYRNATIEADDRAFLMKVVDAVRAAVDPARFDILVGQMRDAKDARMEAKAAPKIVELTAKEYSITDAEQEGVLCHLISGGDLSLYGLANAVTRQAQDVASYDRSTELETMGYKIMTMQPALWRRLNGNT